MSERTNGCVTNFPGDEPKYTIWKSGDYFRAEEFGVGGRPLSIQGDPVFQDLAGEVHRLACEVGQLRRREIESGLKATAALAPAEALIADWLEGQGCRQEERHGGPAGHASPRRRSSGRCPARGGHGRPTGAGPAAGGA